jgi:hypothetical protein
MKTIRYTVRNIPEPVNRYLRKKARISGKSLNQVIVDELSERVTRASDTVGTAFSRFIGSGMDDATLQALDEDDKLQKELVAKDL